MTGEADAVFFWRWRQVPLALAICAFFGYLTATGQWNLYKPWIDGMLAGLCGLMFLSIWLG